MSSVMHGWVRFEWAYLTLLIPMWVGLIRERAHLWDWLGGSFLVAPPLMLIVFLFVGLVTFLFRPLGMTSDGVTGFILSTLLSVFLGYCGGRATGAGDRSESRHRRGAIVANAKPLSDRWRLRRASNTRLHAFDPKLSIRLAGMPVDPGDETKHFKFIGTTGTGKSTAIREMLSVALARGDRAVIADPDGGYLNHFYNAERGDVILNPFDPDALKWDLLREITTDHDVDQLARSLIPDSGGGSDRIWSGYARTFFTAVIQQLVAAGVKDDAEVYRLVTKASTQELRLLLAGTMAGPFLEEGNEKMFGSVRSVTTSAVGVLRYTTQQRGAPFSVRQWIRQGASVQGGGRGGALFLPYKAGEIAALRSVISAWLRIAIFDAMDRSEGDQRLWFIIDELDALGEIDGLKDALARLRKFGGRCVLGLQSISQVSSTYGKGVADTIVENCGNTLILRCSASEQGGTSQFASRLIGQREVVHISRSQTRRPAEWRASTTESEHLSIEPAIMASEIERLADLEGFLKMASIPDWQRVMLSYVNYPTIVRERRVQTAAVAPAPPPASDLAASPITPASAIESSEAPTRRRGRRSAGPQASVNE